MPAASAAIGKSEVSVSPGIELTSRTCGPAESSIRSTRAKPSQRSASQVATAAAVTASVSSAPRAAGQSNRVRPIS